MENNNGPITISTTVNAPISKVWEYWSSPGHIMNWNNASPDWHTPAATNNLSAGGEFTFTMAAKDGSFSFDFGGTYTAVEQHRHIAYTMSDGRTAYIDFDAEGDTTRITETFDPENENPIDMQRAGWQAILDNFKKYTEEN